MVAIVNITGQNNGRNSDQNCNLITTINLAATIYENNIRQISGKNFGGKSEKNYGVNSRLRVLPGTIPARIQARILIVWLKSRLKFLGKKHFGKILGHIQGKILEKILDQFWAAF